MGNMVSAASEAASKSSSGSLNIILIIVVLFGVLYFVMIRPQRNRQRKVQEQANAVAPGSRVRTTAGMYATVVGVDGDDVILEVAPGVEVRYVKRAIMQVLPRDEGPAAEADYAADYDESDDRVDAPPADAEDADHEDADVEDADVEDTDAEDTDAEDADHEDAGQETSEHEAVGDEGADHDGDEPEHAAGEESQSPNGSATAAADERTQGSV
jgi:preprotein translocase subunit YajC